MKIVVVMPFDPAFDDVYLTVETAVHDVNPDWRCLRIDKDVAAGDILDKIRSHLDTCTICIADLTGLNANVLWETGYASALNKPIIAISQTTVSLPFDIHSMTVLKYDRNEQSVLGAQLKQALLQTQRRLATHDQHVIAVAGSHTADSQQTRKVFDDIAAPYFGREFTWYCGARDPMQHAILHSLLHRYERIVVVHPPKYPLDAGLLDRLRRHGARVLDPHEELARLSRRSQPEVIEGFDSTFTLYAQRAERIFLLWNGQAGKTRDFSQWLAANGRSYLLTRV